MDHVRPSLTSTTFLGQKMSLEMRGWRWPIGWDRLSGLRPFLTPVQEIPDPKTIGGWVGALAVHQPTLLLEFRRRGPGPGILHRTQGTAQYRAVKPLCLDVGHHALTAGHRPPVHGLELGVVGGVIAGRNLVVDYIRQKARPFLFSSAVLAVGLVAFVALLAVTALLWGMGLEPTFTTTR